MSCFTRAGCLAFVSASVLSGACFARVAESTDDTNSTRMAFNLGLWAMSIDGDATSGPYTADISVDFDDLLDATSFALMGGFEVGRGRWAFVFNGVLSQLDKDGDFNVTLPDGTPVAGGGAVAIDMYIGDFAVAYEVMSVPVGESGSFSLSPAVGVRVTYFDLDINPDNRASASSDETLFDPYLGGRAVLRFNRAVAWRTEASIGGFGAGSDLTWTAQTFIDWRFHSHIELNVGYRGLGYDVSTNNLDIDLVFHGPWIGATFYIN